MATKALILLTVQALSFQFGSSVLLDIQGKARPALIQLLSEAGVQPGDYKIEVFQSEPATLAAEKIVGSYYESTILMTEDNVYPGKAKSEDEVILADLTNARKEVVRKIRELPGKVWKVVAYGYNPGSMGGEYGAGFYRGKTFNTYVKIVFLGGAPASKNEPAQSSIIPPKHFSSQECMQLASKLLTVMNDLYERDFFNKSPSAGNESKTPEEFLQAEISNYSKK